MNKDIQNTCVITITGEPNDCKDCIFEKCKKYRNGKDGKSDEFYVFIWYCILMIVVR